MTDRAPNINRSRAHEDIVQRLAVMKLHEAERSLFPTIRELLCFAALLGYSEGRKIPLEKDAGVEDVSYQQFERGDAEDLIYMIALADSRDPEVLRDGQEPRCAQIFEEYANGGFHVLAEKFSETGGEFPDKDIVELLVSSGYLDVEASDPDLSGITF